MRSSLPYLVLLAVFLSACTAAVNVPPAVPTTEVLPAQPAAETAVPPPTAIPGPTILPAEPLAAPALLPSPTAPVDQLPVEPDLRRVDDQGAVVIEVTPDTLSVSGEMLNFAIAMNTHSVDLSMDLAALAVLTTDTGLTVHPVSWDGMSGGHHVSGNLVFPTLIDGQPLFAGASTLTLVIQNVDVPERTFRWKLDT